MLFTGYVLCVPSITVKMHDHKLSLLDCHAVFLLSSTLESTLNWANAADKAAYCAGSLVEVRAWLVIISKAGASSGIWRRQADASIP